jgi:hypothetical protein
MSTYAHFEELYHDYKTYQGRRAQTGIITKLPARLKDMGR